MPMSAPLKPLTGSLNTAVKLIGEALVGSAWPAAWLIVTVGRVMSLATVTLSELDVHRTPSTSCATAVRLCEPLPTLLVFQETEYDGDGVESLPMKLPSTKKSTNETVREPTMVTLASTGIVLRSEERRVGKEGRTAWVLTR